MVLKKIIVVTSIIELIIIVVLAVNIYKNKHEVLGTKVSINPISKEDIIFPNQDNPSELKHFYEPAPNKIINNKPSWLPSDYSYTITTNTDGLNERFDYSTEKDPSIFRIVTIGDSFTFGIYVDTKENYPERLEDILNDNSLCKTSKKFEVINLGVWGYDIEYSVHRFKMRGQKYNPDLVLWYLVGNDFSVINEIVSPKAIQYRKEMLADKALLSKFYGKGEFYPWWEKAIQELAEEVNRLGGLEYQKTALDRLNDYYKGKLVLGTFSSLKNLYVQALRDFAKVRSGTYIFDGLTSDYDQFADRHPASKGYEQIASGVFDYINSNHLIPCD